MAERAVFKAAVRQELGSKGAVKLRKQGMLPAIVYGHKEEPTAVSLSLRDFVEWLHHGQRLVDIEIDGKCETLLVKNLQYDHLGKYVIHVDLIRVDMAELITVAVPIETKGTAKGSHEGGIIDEHLSLLEIECAVSNIPEVIVVSIKDLGVGESIHAGDVELPEGAKLITAPDTVMLTCHLVAAAKSTEDLEEEIPAAPEVITAKAEEPEEEKKSK